MKKEHKFTHNGNEFEIREVHSGGNFCIKVFLGENQVRSEYSVDIETHQDYFSQYQEA